MGNDRVRQVIWVVLTWWLASSAAAESGTAAGRGWWGMQEKGWFFYNWAPPPAPEEMVPEQPQEPRAHPESGASLLPPLDVPLDDPVAALAALQAKVEAAKARAVLQPTPEHVQTYLQMQKAVIDRQALFADVGQRTVWATPELDYSLRRPANPAGVQAWGIAYDEAKKDALRKLSGRYGLFFFFRSDCPYCKEFAPYIRNWSRERGFDVIAVTLDGGALPEFPDPRYKPEVAKALGVDTVPAVFLADPQGRQAQPIAFGIVSLSELERRIFKLTQMEPGETIFQVRHQGETRE